VKQDVELTCDSKKFSNIIWIRIISGHLPEFLGGIEFPAKSDHITTKQESGSFVLHISEAKLNDIGLYYCVTHDWRRWKFVTGHFVKVKETESDNSSIIQEPPTVNPGVQTSEKCSLLSNAENKMCSDSPAFVGFIPIDLHKQRLRLSNTVLCLICAALIITVIVLVYCICSMKKKTCSSCCYGKK
uniref:Immunoglobulin subtype domain-containing protein n=1 Tax=Gouania willdenowi TaxID=441366 RepID=A0A8C5HFR5_GOUWI